MIDDRLEPRGAIEAFYDKTFGTCQYPPWQWPRRRAKSEKPFCNIRPRMSSPAFANTCAAWEPRRCSPVSCLRCASIPQRRGDRISSGRPYFSNPLAAVLVRPPSAHDGRTQDLSLAGLALAVHGTNKHPAVLVEDKIKNVVVLVQENSSFDTFCSGLDYSPEIDGLLHHNYCNSMRVRPWYHLLRSYLAYPMEKECYRSRGAGRRLRWTPSRRCQR